MQIGLTKHDLFHGHLYLAHGSGRVGILFHAKEYPRWPDDGLASQLPSLGWCQQESDLAYCARAMDMRNIMWYCVRRASD